MINYLLHNQHPSITNQQADAAALGFIEYARAIYEILPPAMIAGNYFPVILKDDLGQKIALWVTHPLKAKPSAQQRALVVANGYRPAIHSTFDLDRRPFWVLNHLVE